MRSCPPSEVNLYITVEGSRRGHRADSLSLDPEVLAPDAVVRLQDLQSLAYEFFAACGCN